MQSEDSENGGAGGGKPRWIEGLVVGTVVGGQLFLSLCSLVLRGLFSWPGWFKLAVADLAMAGVGFAMGCAWMLCFRRFGRLLGFVAMLLLIAIWVPLTFTLPWHWVAHAPELSADKARDLATDMPWMMGLLVGGYTFFSRRGGPGGTATG